MLQGTRGGNLDSGSKEEGQTGGRCRSAWQRQGVVGSGVPPAGMEGPPARTECVPIGTGPSQDYARW